MKTNNKIKDIDCVALMREIKAKVAKDTNGMSLSELKKFMSSKLKRTKLKLA
jgi:hypothetical protein